MGSQGIMQNRLLIMQMTPIAYIQYANRIIT